MYILYSLYTFEFLCSVSFSRLRIGVTIRAINLYYVPVMCARLSNFLIKKCETSARTPNCINWNSLYILHVYIFVENDNYWINLIIIFFFYNSSGSTLSPSTHHYYHLSKLVISYSFPTSNGYALPLHRCSDPLLSFDPQWKWSCSAINGPGRFPPFISNCFSVKSSWTFTLNNNNNKTVNYTTKNIIAFPTDYRLVELDHMKVHSTLCT